MSITESQNQPIKNENNPKPAHTTTDLEILFFEFLATDLADCQETRNRMLVSYTYIMQLLKEQS
jgi:hypothetical protein